MAQDTFLDAFATSANMRAACKVANVSRTTVYAWQEHDEAFSLRYKQAEADANDVIRAAIYTRAVQGVDKPLHFQGRLVTDPRTGKPVTVKEYSDTLLIFLAKARMPEFREKQRVEVTGEDGGPVEMRVVFALPQVIEEALPAVLDAPALESGTVDDHPAADVSPARRSRQAR